MKKLMIFIFCIEICFPWLTWGSIVGDYATPAHLAVISNNMCFPARITQVQQCWQRTGLCKNQDMLCVVMTDAGRPALVCNVVNGQAYVFCD